VKVNGKAATVTSTDGGAPFRFEGIVDLDAGANIVVEAVSAPSWTLALLVVMCSSGCASSAATGVGDTSRHVSAVGCPHAVWWKRAEALRSVPGTSATRESS